MHSIAIEDNRGGIRIRVQVAGKRYSFAPIPKGKYRNTADLRQARQIAKQITLDIETDNFDQTLWTYKNRTQRAEQGEKKEPKKEEITLDKLWDQFLEYKKSLGLAHSTIDIDYCRRVGNIMSLLPTYDLKKTALIRDWVLSHKSPSQARKILARLNECYKWAQESELIEENPMDRYSKAISKSVRKGHKDSPPDPFNKEERDEIIQAFTDHPRYNFYAPFIKFLFYVGCRPSEATALKWSDIQGNTLTFRQAYVLCEDKDSLKTQKTRTIILNDKVIQTLDEQRLLTGSNSYVFLTIALTRLNWDSFNRNAWHKVLDKLPHIRYRNPYQIRHTYITLNVQAGESLTDIALYCGNSPKIILSNYAGITRNYIPPDL